ncbi:GPW/gp25 family protein [Sorangium sp. So ce1151]|uniref:GPW/gp25 family protein n=1 Tax=Sorangium sp. So ce1151 TaxID=3133332 RepID=UPI003F630309
MRPESSFLGRGWAFPPSFSRGGADVEMVSGPADVQQSLQILVGTSPGERVLAETFGCDLASLVFEELDQGLINTIERLLTDAILEHEPRIQVDRIDVAASDAQPGCVLIAVNYTIRDANSRFNMVFPFYLTEATLPGW